ncbi:MAG TPA: aldehyde dehydrogenase family protein [Thermoanaerobaculia bacterium]|nr:aldehyde dehydrogenase family protein [Thermoanaerobaculia bacterium]
MASIAVADPSLVAVAEIDRIFEAQRENRGRIAATTADERRRKIRRLEHAMMARREEIRAAMWADFHKPPEEVDLSEIYQVLGEARHAAKHVARWMKARRVGTPLAHFGSSSRIVYEPKGVVLIIAPWNFPFNLSLGPVISAIAAGNCVVLKPSELTPKASACMKRLLGELFEGNEVAVVEGDARVAEALLRKRFDHVFFTGGPAIGKLVMKAAAEHLTSVTLELGGKNPVIVDRTADLDGAARKIAWGKLFNSGQSCVAPDYLLIDEAVRASFIEKLRDQLRSMEGEGSRGVIVNERHGARLRSLCESAVAAGAEVITGGSFGSDVRAIPPTVLGKVSPDSAIMKEEIFGPVLPMLTYRNLDEAIAFVREREKPLTVYLFSRSRDTIRAVEARTSSGAMVVNHTVVHFSQINLPFGGVGDSGFGKGHGFYGFQAFSNLRAVLVQRMPLSPTELMFPPYTKFKRKLIELTLKYF